MGAPPKKFFRSFFLKNGETKNNYSTRGDNQRNLANIPDFITNGNTGRFTLKEHLPTPELFFFFFFFFLFSILFFLRFFSDHENKKPK